MTTFSTDIATLIDAVIDREGDYSNHPADKGGPTRWGVTEQVARANGYAGDMRNFPRTRAAAIYARTYWLAPAFNAVDARYPELAAELFDIGVNMGVNVASAMLQRVLNSMNSEAKHYPDLAIDSRVGPLTLYALDAFKQRRGVEGGERLAEAVRSLKGARYIEITEARPANEAFNYGWFGRMVEMAKARFRAGK